MNKGRFQGISRLAAAALCIGLLIAGVVWVSLTGLRLLIALVAMLALLLWLAGLRYIVHLRFQLLSGTILLALPLAAETDSLKSMLGNLFEVSGPEFGVITLFALLAAWAVMVTTEVTGRHAKERFYNAGSFRWEHVPGERTPEKSNQREVLWVLRGRLYYSMALAAPVIVKCFCDSQAASNPAPFILGFVKGLAFALGVVVLALIVRPVFVPKARLLEVWLIPGWVSGQARLFRRLRVAGRWASRRRFLGFVLSRFRGLFHRLMKRLGPGYWEKGRPVEGHASALVLLALSLLVYLMLICQNNPIPAGTPSDWLGTLWSRLAFIVCWLGSPLARLPVPPLAYVLMLAMWIFWILPGLAFWLDRWLVSTLLSIVLFSLLAHQVAELFSAGASDHYYRVTAREGPTPPSAGEALEQWQKAGPGGARDTMIVVSAAGGGIAAAAWSAYVLTGLEGVFGADFRNALFLISAVSGGSVGTMYYTANFNAEGRANQLRQVRAAAAASSLAAAIWGLAGPDFWRFFIGGAPRHVSRGMAQEAAWSAELARLTEYPSDQHAGNRERHRGPSLREWSLPVAENRVPLVLYNATVVETGEPFVFSPVRVGPAGANFIGFQNFLDTYPEYDVELVTAARMSATFPFVAPVARPWNFDKTANKWDTNRPAFHLADGGYYDNFGVFTLLSLLERLVQEKRARNMKKILLIQISLADTRPQTVHTNMRAKVEPAGSWALSFAGPLQTLGSVRKASQPYRNAFDISLFKERLNADGGTLEINTAAFALNKEEEIPLSWHLTASESNTIHHGWIDIVAKGADTNMTTPLHTVAAVLGLNRDELAERCGQHLEQLTNTVRSASSRVRSDTRESIANLER